MALVWICKKNSMPATLLTAKKTERSGEVSVRPLRVCHVSMCLETGGLERLLVEFGRNCSRDRFELDFVALAGLGRPADDLRQLGFSVQSVAEQASGKLARLKQLVQLFRESKIDIVHTHNTLAHFYAATAAKLAGVPVVINTQHGRGCGDSWKARLQFRLANRLTDRVVGVSEDAAALCRRDDQRSSRKTIAIWNGIDLDRFEYRGPAVSPVAICVARLSPEKDFSSLIRAIAQVVEQHADFRLKIVGDGQERPHLEQLARDLGLESHVEFLGECSDVPQKLAEAAFFVSASRTEGISLTLLEAMAVGLPIVATEVGGNPEIVERGVTGELVPSGQPEQLANAICRMLERMAEWPAIGELARQRVERHFDVRQMVQKYEALYEALANGNENQANEDE